MRLHIPFVAIILAALLMLDSSSAFAALIVADNFNGSNGDQIAGRTPNLADVPGTTFITATNAFQANLAEPQITTAVGNPTPSAQTGFNGATYLNIGSHANYAPSRLITVSADLSVGSVIFDNGGSAASGDGQRGVGLGFFTGGTPSLAVNTGSGYTGGSNGEASSTFTGLTINPTGTLDLLVNGTPSQTLVAAAPTGFSASNFYNLTYTVDTVTGSLSHILYNGQDVSSVFASGDSGLSGLIAGSTFDAGFYGSTGINASFTGFADNFSISSVPEPSTVVAFLGMAGMAGLIFARRRVGRQN